MGLTPDEIRKMETDAAIWDKRKGEPGLMRNLEKEGWKDAPEALPVKRMKKTVCVDLDGVLAFYDSWKGVDHIGEPRPGAVDFTRALSIIADVVIYTTRCNEEMNRPERAHLLVNRVKAWLDKHGFQYADIYAGQGKPIAAAYIDDRAIAVPENLVWDSTTTFDILVQVRGLLDRKTVKKETP